MNMKTYRYYFVDIDLEIFADNGDDCEAQYARLRDDKYEGVIELTNLHTGYTNKMLPIKFA